MRNVMLLLMIFMVFWTPSEVFAQAAIPFKKNLGGLNACGCNFEMTENVSIVKSCGAAINDNQCKKRGTTCVYIVEDTGLYNKDTQYTVRCDTGEIIEVRRLIE